MKMTGLTLYQKNSDNLNSNSFHNTYNYYDLLYKEKDYINETKYVIKILKGYSPHATELLELGIGTGNYSKQFIDEGYTVTGIEKNPEMAALAHTKLKANFTPITDDIISFEINRTFDAAISLFHVISYLTENEQVLSCFKQVAKHLNKKGLFIFDVWYTPAVYTQQPGNAIKKIFDDLYEITRVATPVIHYQENVVQVNYDLRIKHKASQFIEEIKETHLMRHFSTPEINLLAELSGFTLIKAEEFLTAKAPDASTWGVCYILQKV